MKLLKIAAVTILSAAGIALNGPGHMAKAASFSPGASAVNTLATPDSEGAVEKIHYCRPHYYRPYGPPPCCPYSWCPYRYRYPYWWCPYYE
jgi:hypothetical protein